MLDISSAWKAPLHFIMLLCEWSGLGSYFDLTSDILQHFRSFPNIIMRVNLIRAAAESYTEHIIPNIWLLRHYLISIVTNWEILGFDHPCPVSFTPQEITQHQSEEENYKASLSLLVVYERLLGMRSDGWVSSDDYNTSVQRSKELKELYLKELAGEFPIAELERIWPLTP